jgi:hypothetical protein
LDVSTGLSSPRSHHVLFATAAGESATTTDIWSRKVVLPLLVTGERTIIHRGRHGVTDGVEAETATGCG